MPTDIRALIFTLASVGKLGARQISEEDVGQILRNRYEVVRNRWRQATARRFLIGLTDGGRCLTVVVEQTDDPTTWLVVTGWESTAERKIIER